LPLGSDSEAVVNEAFVVLNGLCPAGGVNGLAGDESCGGETYEVIGSAIGCSDES
jgi:hypothetical protein